MLVHNLLALLLLYAILVIGEEIIVSNTTERPESLRTGKLNQFKGYYTPKPIPQNIQRLYASIWAGWSAWSFCVNNAQIRVRACNTVRGFSCLGPNQETKECSLDSKKLRGFNVNVNENNVNSDYDVIDPWEEDRKEAMKQLYADYETGNDLFKNKKNTLYTTIKPPIMLGEKIINVEKPIENISINFSNKQEINKNINTSKRYTTEIPSTTSPSNIVTSSFVEDTFTTDRIEDKRTTITINKGKKYNNQKQPELKPQVVYPISAFHHSYLENKPSYVVEPKIQIPNKNKVINKPERVFSFKSTRLLSSTTTTTLPPSTTTLYSTTKIIDVMDVIEPLPETTNIEETFVKSLVFPTKKIETPTNISPQPLLITEPTTISNKLLNNILTITQQTTIPPSFKPIFIKEGEVKGLGIRKLKIPKLSMVKGNKIEHDVNLNIINKHEGDVEEAQRDTENALQFMIQNMEKAVKKVNIKNPIKIKSIPANDHDLLFNEEYMKKNIEIRRKPVSTKMSPDSSIDPSSYDDLDEETKQLLEGTLTDDTNLSDPESIKEEIKKLNRLMKEVESDMIENDFTTTEPKIVDDSLRPLMSNKAKSLKLIPQDSGFLSDIKIPLPAVITQSEDSKGQPFQPQLGETRQAQWSDWKEWNECFCNKQVRTRTCIYDNAYHTSGCVGESYEKLTIHQ
ncbi:Thrombospondin, type 1 repeat-containing protein [Strongyloides ratti]|uniref:Thrombospondin, type 1 repeat-containing protein n=1 Tax=Strongyloides ratti TaxID=34506 RepID=A0A090LSI2_STRRB|nr:Thrombospondin, type 1 repeat-containing protein [Strongyloides ratti]CEF70568.1 Thrombospondin, type 1 repeat-containing protein [Strongyloides ratti]